MISALNHHQPSNGNKILVFLLVVLLASSCAVSKKSTKDSNIQIIKGETPKKEPIPDHKTTTPPSGDKSTVKVDTMRWKDVSAHYEPVTTKSDTKETKSADGFYYPTSTFKAEYNITVLIPLDSDEGSVPTDTRFIEFYAGLLMGLDALDQEGIKLKIRIIDTEEGDNTFDKQVLTIFEDHPDLIIGPYERDDIKSLADQCKNHGTPLVSPWLASTKITSENPFYIQIKPNLKDHFKKLVEYTATTYKKGEVAIIVRNDKESGSWVDYFQQNATLLTGNESFYLPMYIAQDSLAKGKSGFKNLLNAGIKAVILPSYAFEDESFILMVLKRLSFEKENRTIDVFGMPLIYESEKIDFELYQTLNINVVLSENGEPNTAGILKFKQDYLQKYGEIPSNEAIKAFDLISFLGRNIWKYGTTFQYHLWQEDEGYLLSRYYIVKTKSDETKVAPENSVFDYFENKYLNIMQFKDYTWQIKY